MQKMDEIYAALRQYWGYTLFRPLQEDVISSILKGQDTLVMLPTGGGKSLCFQLPAMLKDGMAVVISPLISLMKDQVDSLVDMGISAAYLNSSQKAKERASVIKKIQNGEVKLLYISPERLQNDAAVTLLKSVPLSFFVIDEAHCISHWGHDFRADYRNLKIIKEWFEGINVHTFTATATEEVQRDIVQQLGLHEPGMHIGGLDRANLTYRIRPRSKIINQIKDVLEKHPDEAGIIYCLRRNDVDKISKQLNLLGYKNLPYHAGLSDDMRRQHQDKFALEEVDIIVATVAFGMGIDRSNIRFVIHAAMPKSIEHYHQETGRAGRDGLNSYCYMFYGGNDYRTLSSFIGESPNQKVMMDKLSLFYNFCTCPKCRHKVLVNYFGQNYRDGSCDACDYCLNELDMVDGALIVSQKILSCVARVRMGRDYGFGADYIVSVLQGKKIEQIMSRGDQNLSTFGLMADESVVFIRYMIEQLIGQGFLQRDMDYSTLSLTDSSRQVLRAEKTPVLAKPLITVRKKEIAKRQRESREMDWSGIDRELFSLLREERAKLAQKKRVPAYIIFGDKSLKDMALKKPVTREEFADVFGVGESKVELYAEIFTAVIKKSGNSY